MQFHYLNYGCQEDPAYRQYGRARKLVNAILFTLLLLIAPPTLKADSPQTILMIGDSLTAGYGLRQEHAIPVRLQAALIKAGKDVKVINAGVSGDTSAGGLSRFDWALSARPDAVIVELGANDGLRGLDPEATFKNLDVLLMKADAAGLPVLLAGMKAPPNLGPEYGDAFNAVYPRLAKKHDVILYPFFLEGVAARAEFNQDDAIHPNADGANVIVENLMPAVQELLVRVNR